jgi:hypothetical protein
VILPPLVFPVLGFKGDGAAAGVHCKLVKIRIPKFVVSGCHFPEVHRFLSPEGSESAKVRRSLDQHLLPPDFRVKGAPARGPSGGLDENRGLS